jgi:alkylation response protein AidB-like acyl-CoA dehydrogenase
MPRISRVLRLEDRVRPAGESPVRVGAGAPGGWIGDPRPGSRPALLTLDAAHKIDQGDEARVEVSLIKFYAARVLHDVIDRAAQVHGASGLTDETPLAGMLAMARGARIRAGATVREDRRM